MSAVPQDPLFPDRPARPVPPPLKPVLLFVLALALLVLLEGPRAAWTFWHFQLPEVLASLAMVWAAVRWLPARWLQRGTTAPLCCAVAALLGGVAWALVFASTRPQPLLQAVQRPIVWHSVGGSFVMGGLIGAILWWLGRERERQQQQAQALVQAQVQALRSQAEASQAAAENSRMALQLLQARIEPHFLYNALATLRYLVRHDGARAQHLVEQLIRYFRAALPTLREERITLAQELELCAAFAEIQSVRTEGQLRYEVQVPEALRSLRVAPGVLMVLLENAFKHGVPHEGAAVVQVTADLWHGVLELGVSDNGPGPHAPGAETELGSGEGLRWLAERLRLAHGEGAGVRLLPGRGGGCRAVVRLPCEGPAEGENHG